MAKLQKEIKAFFESEEGEQIIGQIVIKAVNQALCRNIQFEDRKTDPGRTVEKTERWNILDWLVKYMPHIEAVRGCQADSAQARNRSTDVLNILSLIQTDNRQAKIAAIEIEKKMTQKMIG